MEADLPCFLHEDFDYMIDELRGQGKIKDSVSTEVEQDDLLNLVATWSVRSSGCSAIFYVHAFTFTLLYRTIKAQM